MADNCKNCRFWRDEREAGADTGFGYCRRRAPSEPASNASMASLWPRTCSHHWCGEHEPRPGMQPRPSCRTCRWGASYGTYCHRHAPAVGDDGGMRRFPALEPGDFCGDWEAGDESR